MPTASSLAWKTFRKVRTLWHCSRLRSVALPMIDRGDIRQAIDRCRKYSASPALVMVSSSIWPMAWLQNSKKRAERSEKTMASRVTAFISVRVICIIVCPLAHVNCHRDNAITMPSAQKCQRTEAGERVPHDMQMRQRDVAAPDAKYTMS